MEREETPAMSSETPIKPGDVVRWRQRDLTVACVISEHLYWCGWPPGSIPVERATLVESCSPEQERRVVEQCSRLEERNDPRRSWGRKEALARGWRELDREDVTLESMHEVVRVDGERIGQVYNAGDRWYWEYDADHYGVRYIAVDHDAAINAVIAATNNARKLAAENARRAQEKDHA